MHRLVLPCFETRVWVLPVVKSVRVLNQVLPAVWALPENLVLDRPAQERHQGHRLECLKV